MRIQGEHMPAESSELLEPQDGEERKYAADDDRQQDPAEARGEEIGQLGTSIPKAGPSAVAETAIIAPARMQ